MNLGPLSRFARAHPVLTAGAGALAGGLLFASAPAALMGAGVGVALGWPAWKGLATGATFGGEGEGPDPFTLIDWGEADSDFRGARDVFGDDDGDSGSGGSDDGGGGSGGGDGDGGDPQAAPKRLAPAPPTGRRSPAGSGQGSGQRAAPGRRR